MTIYTDSIRLYIDFNYSSSFSWYKDNIVITTNGHSKYQTLRKLTVLEKFKYRDTLIEAVSCIIEEYF